MYFILISAAPSQQGSPLPALAGERNHVITETRQHVDGKAARAAMAPVTTTGPLAGAGRCLPCTTHGKAGGAQRHRVEQRQTVGQQHRTQPAGTRYWA